MKTPITEDWSRELKPYTVKQGDTLTRIAREHHIPFAEILKANPQIDDPDRINVGQRIHLPMEEDIPFDIHKVKEGDTLWGTAQKYGLPLPALLRANPQIENPALIREGEKINIPSEKGDDTTIHTVKKGDTLFGIARHYGVSLSEILNANPEIKTPEFLQIGELVKVPTAVKAYQKGLKEKIVLGGKRISDRQAFIQSIAGYAQETEKTTGIPASVTIAQAIIESRWGRGVLGKANNFFGIKGRGTAGSITLNVYEYINGRRVKINSLFRRYNNLIESFQDHARVISESSRYREAMRWVDDPKRFVRELRKAGYATNPRYADIIIGIMERYNLYQYNMAPLVAKEERL
ncbi:MAG: LysM peptidoglycan-binding domain-containing protein [bacterium]